MKKMITVLLSICICLFMSGCDLLSPETEELLTPPQLTGEMHPIEQALKDSVSGQYTLRYPSFGEQRSAVMLRDVNHDGKEEAFAFYSTAHDDLITMHINAIVEDGDDWKSKGVQSITAAGLEKVEFCDLDGDGIEEIVVGWEVYAQSEKQVAIYSFKGGKLTSLLMQPYTSFVCCDLDKNGFNELFIHLLDVTNAKNMGAVYTVTNEGSVQTASCLMDNKVTETNKPILSTLSNGAPAIYIDETKGVGAITEVLFIKDGKLVNGLLDSAVSMENIITLRPASIYCRDIDGDDIPEIPIATDLPNADTSSVEKLYYTNWCSYDGATITQKKVSIINTADGYMLEVPQKWLGNIAVAKDTSKKTRTIYSFDSENQMVGVKLVTFKVIDERSWNKEDYDKKGMIELCRNAGFVYTAAITSYEGELALGEEAIKNMFSLTA